MTDFNNKISEFININSLFSSGDRVLLAVSGGADSITMLHILSKLKTKFGIELVCAHVNHQLRHPDAEHDENFVIEQAKSLDLPIVTRKVDVKKYAHANKLSIETAARDLRLRSLIGIAHDSTCNKIATAHHKNDNAETIIQRLTRGTGFRGLAGIWPKRDLNGICFVRPLLCITRNKILDYLAQNNLSWRHDHTNDDISYRRNFIRHKLLPEIQKKSSSDLVEELFELSSFAGKLYAQVSSRADKLLYQLADCAADSVTLNLKNFSQQPKIIRIELLRRAVEHFGTGEGDLTQLHYENLLKISDKNAKTTKIELPGKILVRREYDNLIFSKVTSVPTKLTTSAVEIQIPGKTTFGRFEIEARILSTGDIDLDKFKSEKNEFTELFDLDKLTLPLTVRSRIVGDRFIPFGASAEKRVGKFLTDQKIPNNIRDNAFVVADTKNIIWLCPIRISDIARLTPKTQKILHLQIIDTASQK